MEDALRKEIFHTVFMEVCLLSKEEIKDVLCYLRWFLTQKMKHFCVINYPAEELEYDD
jgi:hypothetical protein